MLKAKRFLKTLATGRLGYTLEEFELLVKELGVGEQLLSSLKGNAAKKNITLENLGNEVASLKYQAEGAASAHTDWQPQKVHLLIMNKIFYLCI